MNRKKNGFTEGGKVRSIIRMKIPLEKHNEALEILGRVSGQARFEPYCISSRLYRGVDEVRTIMLEEFWESGRDIVQHLKSDTYRRILLVIEMAEEPPDIRFESITHAGGVEVIEQARKQT